MAQSFPPADNALAMTAAELLQLVDRTPCRCSRARPCQREQVADSPGVAQPMAGAEEQVVAEEACCIRAAACTLALVVLAGSSPAVPGIVGRTCQAVETPERGSRAPVCQTKACHSEVPATGMTMLAGDSMALAAAAVHNVAVRSGAQEAGHGRAADLQMVAEPVVAQQATRCQ